MSCSGPVHKRRHPSSLGWRGRLPTEQAMPRYGMACRSSIQPSLRCGLRLRHRFDRLKNTAGDLVGIAGRVRTPIFEVAFVAVFDEIKRQTDGSPAIGQTVIEFVNRLGLVQTGQTQMIVRSIHRDMFVLVLV